MNKAQSSGKVRFILPIVWILGTLIWCIFLSDFSRKKVFSSNDLINIIFIVIFGLIIVYSYRKLTLIFDVKQGIVKAIEKLKNNSIVSDSEIIEALSNNKSKQLYQEYINDRQISLENTYDKSIVASIDDFINMGNYAEYFSLNILEQIPGALTGIGMLGTFVGLSFGLANFKFLDDSAKIAEQIDPLMSCIQLAFVTSIFGLILSIVFNFIFRSSIDELEIDIDIFDTAFNNKQGKSTNEEINALLNSQTEQLTVLESFGDSIADKITETIEIEYERMQDTYLQACTMLSESHEKALEQMVEQFKDKLFGSITGLTQKLSDSVTEAIVIQENSISRMKESIAAINSL